MIDFQAENHRSKVSVYGVNDTENRESETRLNGEMNEV